MFITGVGEVRCPSVRLSLSLSFLPLSLNLTEQRAHHRVASAAASFSPLQGLKQPQCDCSSFFSWYFVTLLQTQCYLTAVLETMGVREVLCQAAAVQVVGVAQPVVIRMHVILDVSLVLRASLALTVPFQGVPLP